MELSKERFLLNSFTKSSRNHALSIDYLTVQYSAVQCSTEQFLTELSF